MEKYRALGFEACRQIGLFAIFAVCAGSPASQELRQNVPASATAALEWWQPCTPVPMPCEHQASAPTPERQRADPAW